MKALAGKQGGEEEGVMKNVPQAVTGLRMWPASRGVSMK